MLETKIKASENFCGHQIRLPHELKDSASKDRTLIAYIDIDKEDNTKHRVYLAADLGFVQRVTKIFLEEDESNEETLIDMMLETANLIVGSAKVIAEELGKDQYTINTPHFLKIDTFNFEYDEIKILKVESDEMIIAIKELNE